MQVFWQRPYGHPFIRVMSSLTLERENIALTGSQWDRSSGRASRLSSEFRGGALMRQRRNFAHLHSFGFCIVIAVQPTRTGCHPSVRGINHFN